MRRIDTPTKDACLVAVAQAEVAYPGHSVAVFLAPREWSDLLSETRGVGEFVRNLATNDETLMVAGDVVKEGRGRMRVVVYAQRSRANVAVVLCPRACAIAAFPVEIRRG